MRRIEPAFPDLVPISHVLRPGYLPGRRVALDPIRMGVVWDDAPRRILPAQDAVPRQPLRVLAFARVAAERRSALAALIERGSSVLLVLDDPELAPSDLGLNGEIEPGRIVVALPVLPSPLADDLSLPTAWLERRWGAILGLFPFPGAGAELERRLTRLKQAGASFAITAPLLLTPKDRHRILDGCDGTGVEDRLENSLFHADVGRGLHALERRAGVTLDALRMDAFLPCLVPQGCHPNAVRTAAMLRLWARRLDQVHEESSWGWRLRRAATAVERVGADPHVLADEDNLRVVPGFDPWVEGFTRSIWHGGDPVETAWRGWSRVDGQPDPTNEA